MLLIHAASIAAAPRATLRTLSALIILVGATAAAPAPARAQMDAFGAPVTRHDAAASKTDATPAVQGALYADAAAFAAPVAATPPPAAPPVAMTPALVAQAAPVGAPSSTWRVEVADMNVRRVIERWSRTAAMQVIYEANRDVDIGAAAAFSGTYEHALQQLFAAIESSEMPLRACLYANAVTRVIPRVQRCD